MKIVSLFGGLGTLMLAACAMDGGHFSPLVDGPPPASFAPVPSGDVAVGEGQQVTFTVTLSADPGAPVTATLDLTDATRLSVFPSALSFTSADWDQPHDVTVSALVDDDAADDTLGVTVAAGGHEAVATVAVADDDILGIAVEPATGLAITEGHDATVHVRLTARPALAVQVAVSPSSPVVGAEPLALTFDPSAWDQPQPVTVHALDDVDTTTTTSSVSFTATGLVGADLTISTADDDVVAIAPSETDLGVLVEATQATFAVVLTRRPPGTVVVTAASSDPTAVAVSPTLLTFTTETWDVAQTVAVTSQQDDDLADEQVSITLRAPELAERTVAVVVDDEDVQAIVLSPPPATVNLNEGATTTLGARLAFRPADAVTVALSSSDPAVATVAPASLSFTSSDWDRPQDVTVSAVIDDDFVVDHATITAAAAEIDDHTFAVAVQERPGGRFGHALAYDAARGRVVLFGGLRLGNYQGDTWEWDGAIWVQKRPATSPPGRNYHALAYDAVRGRVVLFGGGSTAGDQGDTWEWDGTNWVQKNPATSPPARRAHALAYDATRGRVVLYGGLSSAGYQGDTWEWDGTSWLQKSPGTAPPARSSHALAYDAARARVVLFGGNGAAGKLGDTWEWDGAIWVQKSSVTAPPVRNSHALAYDAARGRVVLFGGRGSELGNSSILGDTWEWDGTSWAQKSPSTSPPARSDHALAYDAARARVVLFSGVGIPGLLGDTWEWDGTSWAQTAGAAVSP